MDELSEIKERYKQFPDHKLIQLWQERSTLRSEAIPILKAELVSRGYEEEVLKHEAADGEEIDYSKLSLKEIQEVVSDRLQRGEYIQSIKADLEDHGVDVLQVFNSEQEKQEGVYEHISALSNAGVDNDYINQTLKEQYGLDETGIEEVKNEMWSRASAYTKWGVGVTIFGVIALMAGIGGAVPLRPGIVLVVAGIGLLAKGKNQGRK